MRVDPFCRGHYKACFFCGKIEPLLGLGGSYLLTLRAGDLEQSGRRGVDREFKSSVGHRGELDTVSSAVD